MKKTTQPAASDPEAEEYIQEILAAVRKYLYYLAQIPRDHNQLLDEEKEEERH